MDKNFIKKTALELADQIIILENIDDKELKALKKEKDPTFKTTGESAVSFHIKALKELIEML